MAQRHGHLQFLLLQQPDAHRFSGMGDIVLQVTGLQCFQADAVYISASAEFEFNRLCGRLSLEPKINSRGAADVAGIER